MALNSGMVIVLGIGFIGILVFLARQGLFASVDIKEQKTGPYLLVYKHHIGDYSKVAPLMDEVYYSLKSTYSIDTTKGFGLYYDSPRDVPKDRLRSIVGCIVETASAAELQALDLPHGICEYPASESVVATFPYIGKMSIILGVIKVYPKLSTYIESKGYSQKPIMELYDKPNKVIQYILSPNISDEETLAYLT